MSAQLEQPAQPSGRSYPEIKEQLTNAARATTSAAAALNVHSTHHFTCLISLLELRQDQGRNC